MRRVREVEPVARKAPVGEKARQRILWRGEGEVSGDVSERRFERRIGRGYVW